MKKKKMIKFRLIILMVLCAGLLLGAWIVRGHLIHEPFRTNVRQAFQAPCREYIFGTDNLGRCVACRILYGAATSLYAAVLAVLAVFINEDYIGFSGFSEFYSGSCSSRNAGNRLKKQCAGAGSCLLDHLCKTVPKPGFVNQRF